jgi:hypothetical protein
VSFVTGPVVTAVDELEVGTLLALGVITGGVCTEDGAFEGLGNCGFTDGDDSVADVVLAESPAADAACGTRPGSIAWTENAPLISASGHDVE